MNDKPLEICVCLRDEDTEDDEPSMYLLKGSKEFLAIDDRIYSDMQSVRRFRTILHAVTYIFKETWGPGDDVFVATFSRNNASDTVLKVVSNGKFPAKHRFEDSDL